MGEISSVAGAAVFIGDTTKCDTVEEYEAQSWTEIQPIEDIGEYGDSNAGIVFISIKDKRDRKLKGSANAGQMVLVCGSDPTDPGQAALVAAQAEKFGYNIKVVYDDAQTLGGEGSIEYFRALIMSKKRVNGTANNVMRRNFLLDIDSEILEEAAT